MSINTNSASTSAETASIKNQNLEEEMNDELLESLQKYLSILDDVTGQLRDALLKSTDEKNDDVLW